MCITGLIMLLELVIILMRSWYFAEQDGMRVIWFYFIRLEYFNDSNEQRSWQNFIQWIIKGYH